MGILSKNFYFFLLRVTSNEDQSKMGIKNISTIFAPILFGIPTNVGTSCEAFVTENAKLVELTEYLIVYFKKHSSIFKHKSSMIQSRYVTKDFKFEDKHFIPG